MPEPLKDAYDTAYLRRLAGAVAAQRPGFPVAAFARAVQDGDWERRELKARMAHIRHCLHELLGLPYREALAVLGEVAPRFGGYQALFFPDFVAAYGLDDWKASLPALAHFTRFSSSEFAVRPFILHDPERMMTQMLRWSRDRDEHVRRLASEGCRPRLPWAAALPAFKRDPAPILPILDRLRADPALYVRRSVANNLNDIAKDNPAVTLDWAQRHRGSHPDTDWIIRHACRTLLKRADAAALALFAFAAADHIEVRGLQLSRKSLRIGDSLEFSVTLAGAPALGRLRVEFGIDYVKASGGHSRKIFQLGEGEFAEGERGFRKRHRFHQMTTRRHYPGRHRLVILVNGREVEGREFELLPE